ncbi:DUF2155 domain-containing protein [Roseovarius atlanticus]|uniref:DUF2155 domain-containing protein n=1 Tax=Roseovarius atlanticus TaxID=1641875 RepID=UPI001C966B5C|nr:DUF2155 domain-containing protein [Roseovarius atlanticus]MBY5989354.1 DUF2155 domain-containing protein [Roseovarius atlanticus]MBY6124746.1 DUF2155 domain-containing protein [Roseovarius atlanticus]MBY6149241.1 DUF2155 domain-containing protein [Roseovarius atlanticus]
MIRRHRAVTAILAALLCVSGAQAQEEVEVGTGVVLRWVDKITTETGDLEIANASAGNVGRMRIELGECRYPAGNPAGDAFAFLTVHPEEDAPPIFSGWMMASSPALNAVEHQRYDIWVLRCITQ